MAESGRIDPEQVIARALTPDDLPEVSRLKHEIFGPRRATEALLRHRYYGSPAPLVPSVAMEADGRLIGCVNTLSRWFSLEGETVLAVTSCDMMLVPEARGGPIRRMMTGKWMELAHIPEVKVAYGVPNRRSAGDMLGADRHWEFAYDVPTYVRIVRPALAMAALPDAKGARRAAMRLALEGARLARLPGTVQSGWQVRVREDLPEDVDALWQRHAALHRYQTVRDHAYLSWRYAPAWGGSYRFIEARRAGELDGLLVVADETARGVRTFVLTDWLLGELPVLDALLSAATDAARSTDGVAGLLMTAMPPEGPRARRLGFLPAPAAVSPYNCSVRLTKQTVAARPWLLAPRAWQLTQGDLDVI
jgi:hypothetical protein